MDTYVGMLYLVNHAHKHFRIDVSVYEFYFLRITSNKFTVMEFTIDESSTHE